MVMPMEMPIIPVNRLDELKRAQRRRDDQDEFLIVLAFALSPLAVLLVLFFLVGSEHMSHVIECGDAACFGL